VTLAPAIVGKIETKARPTPEPNIEHRRPARPLDQELPRGEKRPASLAKAGIGPSVVHRRLERRTVIV